MIEKSVPAEVDYSKQLRKKAADSFQYYQPMIMAIEEKPHEEKLNTLELIWNVIKWAPKTVRAFIVFINLMESLKMTQSTLDTITGVLKALLLIAGIFGFQLPAEIIPQVISAIVAIYAIITAIKGWLSNNPKFVKPSMPTVPKGG